MTSLTFAPFQAHIVADFWQTLSRKKIDEAGLCDDDTAARAIYAVAHTADPHGVAARLDLSLDSFVITEGTTKGNCIARGIIHNTNTLEDFKSLDKNAFLRDHAARTWEDIISGAALQEPTLLVTFALLCFADLKKYHYTYWMSYPTFPSTWNYESKVELEGDAGRALRDAVHVWQQRTASTQWGFFVYDCQAERAAQLSDWAAIAEDVRAFGFVDPSSGSPDSLGWPVRNLLSLVRHHLKLSKIKLLAFRGTRDSVMYHACATEQAITTSMPKAIGWERDNAGKLGPRFANLASVMDPRKLADDAVDLNLKLMKWRIAPDLNLQRVKDTKCLLLGAGTLGCYVSRLLMAWGVSTITFVDAGRVSFSNPVRQPLFKFTDCLDQGLPKAEAAAAALREIYPGVQATGHRLSVPMIGHPFTATDSGEEEEEEDYRRLEALVQAHDAIFLLMDSRESRWLPTVMGAALGKIVINSALGFDSYVVLRHGVPRPIKATEVRGRDEDEDKGEEEQLGCYFCNDVVAPADSTSDRTLDQQCTVTRPGLAALAAATAVELLVSLVQHPLGAHCPAAPSAAAVLNRSPADRHGTTTTTTTKSSGGASRDPSGSSTVLGSVPHTIRGYLRTWENKVLAGPAYGHCSACSPTILQAFREGGWSFVQRAVNERGWIERLSGLRKVQEGIEGVDVDWDEEDED